MEKIQPIPRDKAYKYYEHKQLLDKINELVIAVNRLMEEPAPHEHRRIMGPIEGSYDQFQEKEHR